MLVWLMLVQVCFLSVYETRRIAYNQRIYTTRRPVLNCLKGCTCSRQYWSSRTVDCSYRNLTKIPTGSLRTRDFLNLRGNNITSIKSSDFIQLNQISGLDLRDNPIDKIQTRAFDTLPNLRSLYITANTIATFALHGLNQLQTLRIEGSHKMTQFDKVLLKPLIRSLRNITITKTGIKTIETHTFAGMPYLQYVDLQNNQIEKFLKDALTDLKMLSTLVLSHNNLRAIPNFVENVRSLEVLRVAHNNITSIDVNSFDMANLRVLDLSYNKLKSIKEDLFNAASSLSAVYLQGNQLETLQPALLPSKCTTLNILDLSYNEIDKFEIPDSKDGNNKKDCALRTLKLRGNNLMTFNVSKLNRLSTLDISKNCHLNTKLSDFGEEFDVIDMSECCLTDLPKYFTHQVRYKRFDNVNLHGNKFKTFVTKPSFTNLNLSSNQLENITIDYHSYRTHQIYDLSNNKLSFITNGRASSAYRVMKLSQLILRNNSFTSLDLPWVTNINKLDLSYNQFKTFDYKPRKPSRYLSYRRGLTALSLQGNSLEKIESTTLSDLVHLNVLDLSHNKISSIDRKAFVDNKYLRTLDLSGNLLTNLTDEIKNLKDLRKLNLSLNKLSSISGNAFTNLLRLTEIDLGNNKLQSLPMTLAKFTEVHRVGKITLNLQGNNLDCTCNIKTFLNYYGKFQPTGTCKNSSKLEKLEDLVTTFDALLKSNCSLCPMNPCNYKGTCHNDTVNGFRCKCYTGYTGMTCEHTIMDCPHSSNHSALCRECKDDTCLNGGTCVANNHTRSKCYCPPGYSGKQCGEAICKPNPCLNDATCYIDNDSSKCYCQPGFSGERCQFLSQIHCNQSQCSNNGVCIMFGSVSMCKCLDGFTGDKCDKRSENRGKSAGGGASSSSATIAIVVLSILLVIVIIILVVFIRKYGSCRKGYSNDRVELVNDFE